MAGKTCLVTGATAGIGRVTAGALTARGGQVIVAGRNSQKINDTVQQIIRQTGSADVHGLCADFSDLQQVRDLAQAYKERFNRLDVLVNNAGAFFGSCANSPIGVEMTFHVNHLAPFLLTRLLHDMIIDSVPARILNVSSEAHHYGKIKFEKLSCKGFYFGMLAYARSKLANILFTYSLAQRVEPCGVAVNALHPGHVATDIWRDSFPLLGGLIQRVMGRIAMPAEEGADNSIYLAASAEVEGVSGKYFIEREATESAPLTYNTTLAEQLWTVSEDLTGLKK